MTIRVFPFITLCALLVLSAGVARAEAPKLVPNGNFPAEGPLGVAVDNSCSLHVPPLTGSACTAFDPSAGDLFVTGFATYTAKGELELGRSEKFDASGKPLSSLPSFPAGLYYGAAVNPTNRDLYVASAGSHEIGTYDPNTGELLSSFPVPAFCTECSLYGLFANTTQIATDSAGNVYVPNVPGNEVLEYSPSGAFVAALGKEVDKTKVELREKEEASHEPVTVTKEQEDVCTGTSGDTCGPGSPGAGAGALSGPTGVAVDSSDDVWVADYRNNRVAEFSPSGAFLREFKSEGVRALALYEHEGTVDVLAIVDNSADFCGSLGPPCAHLVEYSSGGAQLADVGAGDFGLVKHSNLPFNMVAVDEASGRVYVTDGTRNLVWVFQPPVAPVLGQESAVEVGTSEAKLGALVNPGGAETTYRFEYDTREYTESEGPHGVSVPFPEGSVGEGFSLRAVWASAKGLAPGTTYHYRVIVTNGVDKPVVGPDQTFTTLTAAQVACPNEQTRGGFSATLPDCRAYELVTPPSKESAQPDTEHTESGGGALPGGGVARNYAANDGNRFSYVSAEVMPGSQSGGLEFIATRGADGWSTEDLIPLQSYTGDRCPWHDQSNVKRYSADLSKAVLFVDGNGGFNGAPEPCRGELAEVVPGEPQGVENLLLRDNETGAYQLINLTPPDVIPTDASLVAASANLNLVIFTERAKLTPEARNNTVNTYEWSSGVVHLLKFALPSGAPVSGSLVSISSDGKDLFFTAEGKLYVRVNGERTIQLDEARGGPGPGGSGSFRALTADGSQVFFTADASAGLTSDTEPGSGSNLYSFDIDTSQLSDLTPVAHAEAGLAGISEDGSYVYFTANAVMSGSQPNQFGETAASGQSNLYLLHDGTITFVKHGGGIDLSANGAFFAFNSDSEIYLYSAAANRFACASCNPSGETPTAEGVSIGAHVPHSVSDNGQVFFQTAEALLPGDTNGVTDVYEYDFYGGLHLISSGTSLSPSTLLDSSASGNDVFFLGTQALVPQDSGQEALKIYDARVDGGFPETTVPVCMTAEACRAAPESQPSIFGEPSSQTFSGAGNLTPPSPALPKKITKKTATCKKVLVRKKGKKKTECLAKKTGKKATKAEKSAHTNRRAHP